jgi:hypothetical protein
MPMIWAIAVPVAMVTTFEAKLLKDMDFELTLFSI